jgi:hypothetical protein
MLLLKLLFLPFRIIWAVVKLAIKIILLPLKLVTGCLLPIVILLILVAVAGYFIYHWLA